MPAEIRFLVLLGAAFLVFSASSYLLVVGIRAGVRDFQGPIWRDLKARLFVASVVVYFTGGLGAGLILAGYLTPMLLAQGMAPWAGRLLPVALGLVLLPSLQTWVNPWAPLQRRLLLRRLSAQGLDQNKLRSAVFVGILEPGKPRESVRGGLEREGGGLWIEPNRIVYKGDADAFEFRRDEVIRISRRADSGRTTLPSGILQPSITFRSPGGGEREIQFQSLGCWTTGAARKASSELACRLEAWFTRGSA